MVRADLLFNEHRLSEVIEAQRAGLRKAIDDLSADRILGSGEADLAEYFEKQYRLDAPVLREDAITVDQHETGVDVSHEWDRAIRDRSRPVLIPGTAERRRREVTEVISVPLPAYEA